MTFLGFGKKEPTMFANPMYKIMAGAVIRHLLTFLGGLTAAGQIQLVDDTQVDELAGALLLVGSIVWSGYKKFKSQQVKNTLAEQAKTTVAEAKQMVASPYVQTPPASTPENVVPSSLPEPKV